MKIDDIYSEWAIDGQIDETDLSKTSREIPKLHNKYFKYYVQEGLKLKKLKADYKVFYKLKSDYYRGDLDSYELKELGWPPQPLKILKTEVPSYVEADKEIVEMTLRISLQESIVEYLESIVKQINNRNFVIKSIIDWEKFRAGLS